MARASKLEDTYTVEDRGGKRLAVAPPEIQGRSADEPTIVRWVADNVDAAEPDPATCPAPFAWTLLRECRETPGFMSTFLEKCWVKLLPPRSQLDKDGPRAQDGKSTIELVDRILAHSQTAEGEALAATLAGPRKKVAEPTPEPKPSAFEAFDPKKEG